MLVAMTSGSPPLSPRPVRDADAATCAEIVAEFETALLGSVETTAAEVMAGLQLAYTDRDASVLLLDDSGEAVASLWVSRDPVGRQTFFVVHPRPGPLADDAAAVGVRLGVEAARRHAREAGAGTPAWTARSGSWLEDERHFATLAEHGFAPVRRFYEMRIDATSPVIPAQTPALPAGVEIVVARDEAVYRALYEVDCAAFADHWNFSVHPYEEWRREFVDSPNRDPDGIWLLTVDGAPAGICVLEDSQLELGDGYVGILGVLAAFRGRGLATLLLQTAFVRDRDLGRRGTRLGVDAENTTGAVGLYEKVGMGPVRTREGWALTLS